MEQSRWRLFSPKSKEARGAFDTIRAELGVPESFPPEVVAQAAKVAQKKPGPEYVDRRDIEFVTIDPASSMDLDQAVYIEKHGRGYRVYYAIADLGFWITPDSALDQEVNKRGMTVYGPDMRTPLHPTILSEANASILPNQDTPVALWTIDLDAKGEIVDAKVERSIVRSRAKLSYETVQEELDNGTASESLKLLKTVGLLRQEIEHKRGGVSMQIPEQEIEEDIDGDFNLLFRTTLPVEGWNAQISLLTGIAAAQIMKKMGVGIYRTLPAAQPQDIKALRASAKALGIYWPKNVPYPELIRNLDSRNPKHAAFMTRAATLFKGAGYLAFDNVYNSLAAKQTEPDGGAQKAGGSNETAAERADDINEPEQNFMHSAIAAEYAHVTAPLRRLVDRYGTEICLAYSAGKPVPQWVLDKLAILPDEMAAATKQSHSFERRSANVVEASVLQDRIGEVFDGVVVDLQHRPGKANMRGEVMISNPAILARIDGEKLELGEHVKARLTVADVANAKVQFENADSPPVAV